MDIRAPQGSPFPTPVSRLIDSLPPPPADPTSALVIAYANSLIGHTPTSFERIDGERRAMIEIRA